MRKIAAEPVPADELEKARGYAKGRFVLRLESPQGTIQYGLRREVLEGEIEEPDELLRRLDEVTVEDVQRVAKDLFEDKRLYLARRRPVRRPRALREAARRLSPATSSRGSAPLRLDRVGDERELLRRTAEIAGGLPRLARRAARLPASSMDEHRRRRSAGRFRAGRATRSRSSELMAREIERGVVATAGGALLRLRHRRRAARDASAPTGSRRLGPERRARRARAVGGGRRGDRRRLAQGPVRPPGRRVVRVHDRLPDGARDGARRRAARTCSTTRLGRRSGGLAGSPPITRRRRRAAARDRRPRAPAARASAARRSWSSRPTPRGACGPTRCARRSRRSTARRSCARRRAR